MIVFVTTAPYAYTHEKVLGAAPATLIEMWPYARLEATEVFPRAVYILTDHDRLPALAGRWAHAACDRMRAQGSIVLNDPVRVLTRAGLLRALHTAGINRFNAYRAEERVKPERWPVFLRCEGDHLGPISGLLHGWDEVRRAIDGAVANGVPFASVIVVEYAAEPVRPGLFRKYSSFRMGKSAFGYNCVDDDQWIAKIGKVGITPDDLYEEEFRMIRDNPHGGEIARAFEIAGLDYGRADFGLVGGRAQIYEINSNPQVVFGDDHPSPIRQRSYALMKKNYLAALRACDAAVGGAAAARATMPDQ
jgi:hypothetical protein